MIADDQVQAVNFSVDNLTSYQNLGPPQMPTIDSRQAKGLPAHPWRAPVICPALTSVFDS